MTDDSSKDLNAGHGGDLAMAAASRHPVERALYVNLR